MIRARILVVDDEPEMRRLLESALRRAGFDVEQAEDGQAALQAARCRRPDLVVADILMPRLDGWELCRHLRSEPATATVPIIFLSSRNRVPDRVYGLQIGADDFLAKPFDTRELVARVEAVLKRVLPVAVDRPAASGISGNLRDMNLVDIAQVLDLGRKTASVRILGPGERDGEVGVLHFVDGRLVHATFGELVGEAALPHLLVLEEGRFEVVLSGQSPQQTLTRSTQELLLDALRKADEARARARATHAPAGVPGMAPGAGPGAVPASRRAGVSGPAGGLDGTAVRPDGPLREAVTPKAPAEAGSGGAADDAGYPSAPGTGGPKGAVAAGVPGRAGRPAAAAADGTAAPLGQPGERDLTLLQPTLLDLFALGVIEPKR